MTSSSATTPDLGAPANESQDRDEFRTPASPEDLRITQVSSDDTRDSSAYYLDVVSFSSDSKRFAFKREKSDDGSRPAGVWLCDIDDGFSIRPIGEPGTVLSVTGDCAYRAVVEQDKLELRRIDLDTLRQEVICTAPKPLRLRNAGLGTQSADGKRLHLGAFLGDGRTEGAPWGGIIFDVEKATHHVIEYGNGFRNMHAQYSHNPEPPYCHDITLQGAPEKFEDGSWLTPADGSWRWKDLPKNDGRGGYHVIVRDDGTNWRMLPICRDAKWHSGGHQTWRGRTDSIVTQTYHHPPGRWRAPLVEAAPVPIASRDELTLGMHKPGTQFVDLSRRMARADSTHFGFDGSGRYCVSDTDGYATACYSFVYVATYITPGDDDPYLRARYLLLPRTSWKTQEAHPHPFLSPDGRCVVFQSDFTGRPQVYVADNFAYPDDTP